jgi:pyrroline-5-carboxylate reductase
MSEPEGGPILLVGAGRMGSALLRGWLAQGVAMNRVIVQEPSPQDEVAEFLKDAGIGPASAADTRIPPDVIVLAVKPQVMDQVAAAVAPLAGKETAILSIAAGRTIASLSTHFGPDAPIVRAMPNLAAAIGRGISALYASPNVTPEQAALCEALMQAAGETVWLDDEAQMDAVTGVSGSGPAYVFLLAESLAKAGAAAGLPPELAARLARATVSGAGELLYQARETPAELRHNVTSPAGTTEAALQVLMGQQGGEGPMDALLREAVAAATRRARELSS